MCVCECPSEHGKVKVITRKSVRQRMQFSPKNFLFIIHIYSIGIFEYWPVKNGQLDKTLHGHFGQISLSLRSKTKPKSKKIEQLFRFEIELVNHWPANYLFNQRQISNPSLPLHRQ